MASRVRRASSYCLASKGSEKGPYLQEGLAGDLLNILGGYPIKGEYQTFASSGES